MSERLATDNDAGTASQAADTGAKLYNASGEAIQNTAKQTQATAGQFVGLVREQPLAAVLSALIVGYILGKIV